MPNLFHLRLCIVTLFVTLSQVSLHAQAAGQSSSPTSNASDSAGGTTDVATQQAAVVQKAGSDANSSAIREIGNASLLQITPGMFHLGPLKLDALQVSQMYEQFQSPGQQSLSSELSVFRAHTFYQHSFRRSQIAFQYAPQILVTDGTVLTDFSSQNLSFDTYYPVTKRATLKFQDQFSYSGNQARFLDQGLSLDVASGYTLQKNFLEDPGRYIINSFNVSGDYRLNGRTRVTITPQLGYVYTNIGQASNRGQSVGGTVTASRDLSPVSELELFYGIQENRLPGNVSNATYHSIGAGYSRKIGRTWSTHMQLAAGTNITGDVQHWTPQASLSVIKTLRRASLALAYARTNTLTPQLRNGYADQLDVTYRTRLGRRLFSSVGAGRYSEIWTLDRNSAYYGSVNIGYMITPQLSWTSGFMYRNQSGSPLDVLIGTSRYILTGLQWRPGDATSH